MSMSDIPPAPRGPRVAEGRPWDRHNSDGSINLGSYAIQASVGMVELAQKLCLEHMRAQSKQDGEKRTLDLAQVRSVANALLSAADMAQAAVRADGRFDRMDNSHARARGATRMAIDAFPVPFGADLDEQKIWCKTVALHAAALIKLAVELDQ